MLTTSMLLIFVAMLLGQTNTLSFLLIFLLGTMMEWQNGISENNNQYDVKSFGRFQSEGDLCMEVLHQHQHQNHMDSVNWMAFVISAVIRLYTLTCILCTSNDTPSVVFKTPLVVIIVFYSGVFPILSGFIHLNKNITFCQLEVVRACADVAGLVLITAFSLV